MPVNPVTIWKRLQADLVALFPATGTREAYRIHGSFGVSANNGTVDSNVLRARYNVRIDGNDLLRGWWVDWMTLEQTRRYVSHGGENMHAWLLNGVYEIRDGDSDAMTEDAMNDVHSISEHYRLNPSFQADGTSIMTIVPDGTGGVQYERNENAAIELAGADVYMPSLALQTFHPQE